jgi:hypothetical protein
MSHILLSFTNVEKREQPEFSNTNGITVLTLRDTKFPPKSPLQRRINLAPLY